MRRFLLIAIAAGTMLAVTALSWQGNEKLLLLEWAAKAKMPTPPVAILIEMGVKDVNPRDWSGKATVNHAKVVHREGYRFQGQDKLVDPDAWEAGSHRAIRAPKGNPAVAKIEPIASVGIVLHIADIASRSAEVKIEPKDKALAPVTLLVRDLVDGRTHPLWDGAAAVRLISTATPVATGKTEDDFPAACYGPDGTLWVAYTSYHVKEDDRRIEPAQLKEQPKDFKKFHTPEFGDQVFAKSFKDGKWSDAIAITGPNEDIVRCTIAAEGNGTAWAIYSAQRDGKYRLYARPIKDGKAGSEEMLKESWPGNHLSPSACTDQNGWIHLVSQFWIGANPGNLNLPRYTCRDGKWSNGSTNYRVTSNGFWQPVIAVAPNRQITTAYDYYDGDYDIGLIHFNPGKGHVPVATSSQFEARPSIVYDAQNRLWLAYEEGPEQWGKDYGAQDSTDGKPLYNERNIRVICLDTDGNWKRPVAELPISKYDPPQLPFEAIKTNKYERTTRYAHPKIGIDGKGRVWLTYRQNFGSRYSSHCGPYWLTFARRLDGDKWSEPIELHHSDGFLDHRPVLLPHSGGGLLVVHNTDGRYSTPEIIDNQIYMSVVDLPGGPVEPKLIPHASPKKDPKLVQRAKDEAAAVKRMREYRAEAGGKKYQYLRGEFHRHTEISWDGAPDGSLEDMFRYGIDAVAFDWIGNGDHDSGAGREYSWWLIQKFTDAYHAPGAFPGAFTPMFTYERSVGYPHGHRNCMFAQRGVRTLPRLASREGKKEEGGVHADDAKMLYRYLHEFDGICASHTSATSMGTDWRDHDPVREPIVEIYQGDRMSYEIEGAPRAGYDPKTNMEPANVAGWFPLGFINKAFAKGYKMGFQASSDHWSTHISYMIVLAEKHDRKSILDAVKNRRCYAATDNIIVDFRMGGYPMGGSYRALRPQDHWIDLNIIGTNQFEVHILRDSQVVDRLFPTTKEFKTRWTDPSPQLGSHYYYVRVLQADNEIAWGSPVWVDYRPEK